MRDAIVWKLCIEIQELRLGIETLDRIQEALTFTGRCCTLVVNQMLTPFGLLSGDNQISMLYGMIGIAVAGKHSVLTTLLPAFKTKEELSLLRPGIETFASHHCYQLSTYPSWKGICSMVLGEPAGILIGRPRIEHMCSIMEIDRCHTSCHYSRIEATQDMAKSVLFALSRCVFSNELSETKGISQMLPGEYVCPRTSLAGECYIAVCRWISISHCSPGLIAHRPAYEHTVRESSGIQLRVEMWGAIQGDVDGIVVTRGQVSEDGEVLEALRNFWSPDVDWQEHQDRVEALIDNLIKKRYIV
ncbi:hypothetical protein SELMODRAFT_420046 [Selaginella moellendorffii]|uniref:Uncharacterized protein n=1 Tax=Selaginella moellendorffii TaxID=88036 RepID=D8SAD4_SELML|nr:hypothetical protein SELMODRAFT_420046 [Selaginella moellendorffii]